jgi:hypothetical protein
MIDVLEPAAHPLSKLTLGGAPASCAGGVRRPARPGSTMACLVISSASSLVPPAGERWSALGRRRSDSCFLGRAGWPAGRLATPSLVVLAGDPGVRLRRLDRALLALAHRRRLSGRPAQPSRRRLRRLAMASRPCPHSAQRRLNKGSTRGRRRSGRSVIRGVDGTLRLISARLGGRRCLVPPKVG